MKLWKIFTVTICLVFLHNISIFANEWSWDIDGYHYYLVREMGYDEWNNRTDVTIYNYENVSYLMFSAGPIDGELAQFAVSIFDLNYDTKYSYTAPSGLSHSMSFSEIKELNLSPDEYRLSIVAKGYVDEALDDYTLYVSYEGPDNSNNETSTDNNNETSNDNNKNNGTITDGNNNITTEKTEPDNVTSNNNSATSKDNPTVAQITPPKRVTLQSAKRLKNNKKKAKLTWKKIKGSNIKYEIKCSTTKKFTKKKTKTYTTKKCTFTISKLSKGQKYYVKVRSYKKVNGQKVYGSYSKIKTIKK